MPFLKKKMNGLIFVVKANKKKAAKLITAFNIID